MSSVISNILPSGNLLPDVSAITAQRLGYSSAYSSNCALKFLRTVLFFGTFNSKT